MLKRLRNEKSECKSFYFNSEEPTLRAIYNPMKIIGTNDSMLVSF